MHAGSRIHQAGYLELLGCIWINNLVREKEKEMKKFVDLTVINSWIFNFSISISFPPRPILHPNTALKNYIF